MNQIVKTIAYFCFGYFGWLVIAGEDAPER